MRHKNSRKPQNLSIKAVIFDLDDTLWPIIPLINHAEQTLFDWLQANAPKVTEQHSIQSMRNFRAALIPTNPRYQFDLWALRHAMLTQLFLSTGEDANTVNNKADTAMQVFAAARNQVSLYDDVIPTLTELGRHFQLGSISNGFADLEQIGLAEHFKVSIAAHQFGCAKPDPSIFKAACAALNVEPQHAVYVGDDVLLDVRGAQDAGLASVWINRTKRPGWSEVRADYECRDLTELLAWLLNGRG
ncbi:HAD family hydrolase [Solimicrobium silvestre]|uniref:HAD-SF-IA-v3: HAD hydrolase, family IA, variant 3 n=1 Tax=Solimicrobium silvestre TaxID=2099400 RepID=A0A2S9GTR2_9BURK|nr:HAD family hydrolase [Solimicrobium silvestre]PRC91091.1 HAD-SF-IA-v3: HAD hydrolase, family IA, variant 3 [Solimicrobium silvestre]